jgi:long-chain acyl-CoA synthetase
VHDDVLDMDLNLLGICSVNKEEWIFVDLALNLIGHTSVPLYEMLGVESLEHILTQTELRTVMGSKVNLLNLISMTETLESSPLKSFVCFD